MQSWDLLLEGHELILIRGYDPWSVSTLLWYVCVSGLVCVFMYTRVWLGGFLPASQDVGSVFTCLSTDSVLGALPVPL